MKLHQKIFLWFLENWATVFMFILVDGLFTAMWSMYLPVITALILTTSIISILIFFTWISYNTEYLVEKYKRKIHEKG